MIQKVYTFGLSILICIFSFETKAQLEISAMVTNLRCYQSGDGAISTTVTGGITPYTYDWSVPPKTPNLANLPAGSYTVTVTDNIFASITGNWYVTEPDEISIYATIEPVSCSPGNDGSISLQVTGGTPLYNYLWSNGPTAPGINGLACGDYTVTVYDNNYCKAVGSWKITTDLAIAPSIIPATCSPCSDAGIDLNVSGGCPPYVTVWNNLATTENINGLDCGVSYCVTVTDTYCGMITGCWVIPPAEIDAAITPASGIMCCGEIDLTVSFGASPYSYEWSNSAPPISKDEGLCAGTYCVTVTDKNGVKKSCCWEITNKKSTCQSNYLQNITIKGGEDICYDAFQSMYVAGSGTTFIVQDGGTTTMIAGENISYMPGTKVYPGGNMHGHISIDGQFCDKKNGNGDDYSEEIRDESNQKWKSFDNRIFKVYPNPSSGKFILELNGDNNSLKVNVEIYSTHGEKILITELSGERNHEFSLAGNQVGVYFIRVVTGNLVETGKIIKQ